MKAKVLVDRVLPIGPRLYWGILCLTILALTSVGLAQIDHIEASERLLDQGAPGRGGCKRTVVL